MGASTYKEIYVLRNQDQPQWPKLQKLNVGGGLPLCHASSMEPPVDLTHIYNLLGQFTHRKVRVWQESQTLASLARANPTKGKAVGRHHVPYFHSSGDLGLDQCSENRDQIPR